MKTCKRRKVQVVQIFLKIFLNFSALFPLDPEVPQTAIFFPDITQLSKHSAGGK